MQSTAYDIRYTIPSKLDRKRKFYTLNSAESFPERSVFTAVFFVERNEPSGTLDYINVF